MRGFWRRRVAGPLLAQLRQGLSPEGLALSLSVGVAVGLFPVIGLTTLLGLALGAALRLNLPALQLANWLSYPLQLVLVLPFVRWGERLLGVSPVPLSVTRLQAAYQADPVGFVARFGLTGLHGVLGWLTALPLVVTVLYGATLPLLRAAGRGLRRPGSPSAALPASSASRKDAP
jgi:hypothetical protein